jgi:hypothetical protein
MNGLLNANPLPTWQEAATLLSEGPGGVPLAARRRAALAYYRTPQARGLDAFMWHRGPRWRFNLYWEWLVRRDGGHPPDINVQPAHVAPLPPPQTGLGVIARDNQNVHTRVVSEQTNTSTSKLLAVKVPEAQQTEKMMARVWLTSLSINYPQFLRVANDVNRWFSTKDCRIEGDNLYRRLLRGLVAKLTAEEDAERRIEMFRRLWEECLEATGMCCEGHISRLCNVLVGFDDDFKPPVAFGELLQSKMAVIAGLDITEEEKRRQANAFFDEYATPLEERTAWLEAF